MTVREALNICRPELIKDNWAIHLCYTHDEGFTWRAWASGYADRAVGPEISDRPASAFLGFFGKEFDAIVEGNGISS